MGRGFWGVFALAATLALGALPASADTAPAPPPLDTSLLLQQAQLPLINLSAITRLPARPPLLGEVLEDPLIVTAQELAAVGPAPWFEPLGRSARSSSSDGPLVVDDDLVQCPNADFTTINAAVQASPPGGRVQACPGRYPENVVVDKTALVLTGTATRTSTCPADDANDETRYAIVEPPAGNGFDLLADNVVVERFVVRGVEAGSDGIITSDANSGYVIQRNIVQDNEAIGIELSSNGAVESDVSRNCIRNQSNIDGLRIGNATNVEIRDNSFESNNQAIDLVDCNCSGLEVEHNDFSSNETAVAAGSFASATQVSASTIEQNRFTNNAFAVRLFPGVSGVSVHHNRLTGNGFGIVLAGATNNVIEKNHASESMTAIQLGFVESSGIPTAQNTVAHNKLESNSFAGIRLEHNAVFNSIHENDASRNGSFGIRAEGTRSGTAPQASNNTIERNKAKDNGTVDCSDATDGTGTAGTANFWIKDQGRTEDRPGICVNK